MKTNIAFMGYSDQCIGVLSDSHIFNLVAVITETGKLVQATIDRLNKAEIPIFFVEKTDDVINAIKTINVRLFLIYKFRYIIPPETIKDNNIFNIHPGDLRNNRGANPLSWSILLGHKSTCLSLHKIDERIDMGLLLAEYSVSVFETDDIKKLECRLNQGLEYLINELFNFLANKYSGEHIVSGIYRRRIEEKDYTIDLQNDTFDVMKRKIYSQKSYRGAVLKVGGYAFYVNDIGNL